MYKCKPFIVYRRLTVALFFAEWVAADDIFMVAGEIGALICKVCQHWISKAHADRHLKRNHPREDEAPGREVARGKEIGTESDVALPKSMDQPIDCTPLYTDGMTCVLRDGQCGYTCRTWSTPKTRWNRVHEWSAAGRRRAGTESTSGVQRRLAEDSRRRRRKPWKQGSRAR